MGGGNFTILTPCQKKWSDLEGDGRSRFCNTVHSVSDYSLEEWNQLWRESNGQVCGLLSSESAAHPRSRRAILVGALLTAVSPLFGASGRIRFRVIDPTGEAAGGASIALMNSSDKPVRTHETDKTGELLWNDLPLGNSVFVAGLPGLRNIRMTITIHNSKEIKVEVDLQAPLVGEVTYAGRNPHKRHGWLVYDH